jgi:ribonuclease J
MYEWLRPRIAVPVHGEAAHLVAHAELAKAAGVAEVPRVRDGDMVRLSPGNAEVIDQVPFGRVYKDGKLIGSDEAVGIKERRKLSFAGHVAVNVVLDDGYGMAGDPDLEAIGLPDADMAGEPFDELLIDAAAGAVDSIPRQRRKDLDLVEDAVRRAVRAAANEAWGKKPMVTVFVTR